jgi:hypothetical protein
VAKDNNLGPVRDHHAADDWPTLLLKLFDDFIRILRGEIKLMGASVARTIDGVLVRSLYLMVLAAIGVVGLFCLMAAILLLLHKWLEWWQAFGVMGVGLLLIVLLGSLRSGKRSAAD